MSGDLPPDFPGYAAAAMGKIKSVNGGIYGMLIKFIHEYWGDVHAISNVSNNIWAAEGGSGGAIE